MKTCRNYRTHADLSSNTERVVINVLNRSYCPVLLTAVADFMRVLTFDNPINCVIPYSSIDGILALLAELQALPFGQVNNRIFSDGSLTYAPELRNMLIMQNNSVMRYMALLQI